MDSIESEANRCVEEAEQESDSARVKTFKDVARKAQETRLRLQMVAADDTTDAKYQIDDEKRRLAQELSKLTGDAPLRECQTEYETDFAECGELVFEDGNDADKQLFRTCEAARPSIVNSRDIKHVRAAIETIAHITWGIRSRNLAFLSGWFDSLEKKSHSLNDQVTVQKLIVQGRKSIESGDIIVLRTTNFALTALLPNREQQSFKGMVGFH